MARNFRFYQKKRGNRRTGSDKLGSVGEALFFAAFFVLGCVGLVVMFVTLVVPEWRANQEFLQATCVVCQTRIGQEEGDEGTLFRPEVLIEYQIGGETYRTWTYDIHTIRGGGYRTAEDEARAALDRFTIGQTYLCHYDASDPKMAVVVRGSTWWVWLSFVVPISFVLIGGGGLAYTIIPWGKSAERRAAIVKPAAGPGSPPDNGGSGPEFPNVPRPAKITDSPGTRLAFRLPVAGSPGWALFGWLSACLLWNGLVLLFVVTVLRGFLRGDPDWLLTVFIVPFVLLGIGLIALFLRKLMLTTVVGSTLIEISDQPLRPGNRYRLFLSQTGRLKVSWLELLLVCEEEAAYRQGTDTRIETRRVYQRRLLRREGFEVRASAPFEAECEVEVPAGAMHSFKSGHNEVAWKLVAQGSPVRWPDYRRSFPIIVYPSRDGNGQA